MSDQQAVNDTPTRVISLRLPSAVDTALAQSSSASGRSVSSGLDWLLLNSFGNYQLLRQLEDCPDFLDSKLDARIPPTTYEQLRAATAQLGIPVSVYVRKLLYHFYVTKRLTG